MARIGRWMGAIVIEAGGRQVLVGNPKEPCIFTPPVAIAHAHDINEPENIELLVANIKAKLLITRNDSVSERLWRLISSDGKASLQWLVEVPQQIFDIVREAVLKCS